MSIYSGATQDPAGVALSTHIHNVASRMEVSLKRISRDYRLFERDLGRARLLGLDVAAHPTTHGMGFSGPERPDLWRHPLARLAGRAGYPLRVLVNNPHGTLGAIPLWIVMERFDDRK